jgi:hypothetical protein
LRDGSGKRGAGAPVEREGEEEEGGWKKEEEELVG